MKAGNGGGRRPSASSKSEKTGDVPPTPPSEGSDDQTEIQAQENAERMAVSVAVAAGLLRLALSIATWIGGSQQ
jgi:hypothetical protein